MKFKRNLVWDLRGGTTIVCGALMVTTSLAKSAIYWGRTFAYKMC